MSEESLYDRLGGIYAIAAVVNRFSDALVDDPIAGKNSPNPLLQAWYKDKSASRLDGLKWMRTLWVASIAGGPYKFVASSSKARRCPFNLEKQHADLEISPEEFDATAKVLARTLDEFKVPAREKGEVLAAFAAHKPDVTNGSMHGPPTCPNVALPRLSLGLIALLLLIIILAILVIGRPSNMNLSASEHMDG